MNLRDELQRLRALDWRELDLREAGDWPLLLQGVCSLLMLALTFVGISWYLAMPKLAEWHKNQAEEQQLLADYRHRVIQTVQLPEMREYLDRLEAQLSGLVQRFPSGAEIPALIDNISSSALDHRLTINFIRLRTAAAHDFYDERPFELQVEGDYHDIAGFLATVTALPRIVTLHDFTLTPVEGNRQLRLALLARTYSYHFQRDGDGQ